MSRELSYILIIVGFSVFFGIGIYLLQNVFVSIIDFILNLINSLHHPEK